jgi:hypothetical protein
MSKEREQFNPNVFSLIESTSTTDSLAQICPKEFPFPSG